MDQPFLQEDLRHKACPSFLSPVHTTTLNARDDIDGRQKFPADAALALGRLVDVGFLS